MVEFNQQIKIGDIGEVPPWIWSVVAVIGLGLLYYFVWPYPEQESERRAKEDELASLTIEVQKAQKIAERHDEFQRDVARLEETFRTLVRILPIDRETPDLLKDLQGFVSDTNLVMERFTPALTAKQKDFYSEWPIKLQLRGGYNDLIVFFNKVANYRRVINVGGLDIKRNSRGAGSVIASCTATTYIAGSTEADGRPPTTPLGGRQ
ncbi:MAG TPA: type 4a pilus biogenesis protein PilO [Acidobacteriota bacterium]